MNTVTRVSKNGPGNIILEMEICAYGSGHIHSTAKSKYKSPSRYCKYSNTTGYYKLYHTAIGHKIAGHKVAVLQKWPNTAEK